MRPTNLPRVTSASTGNTSTRNLRLHVALCSCVGKDQKLLAFPDEMSEDARDVIDVLLSPDPTVRRAGSGQGLDTLHMLPW